MMREFAITVYLLACRIVFSACKLFPLQQKTIFVASFGDDALRTMQEVQRQTDDDVIVLQTPSSQTNFPNARCTVRNFENHNLRDWFAGIYHLATAKQIFIDNYFGILAAFDFKKGVRCMQLWHANGAIKQFGLQDPSNVLRSQRARDRFQHVYDHFTQIAVSSDRMAGIFEASFGAGDAQMLRYGMPRTDFFFDNAAQRGALEKLQAAFPVILDKKVLLYAPTFRDHELHAPTIAMDLEEMYEQLHHDYVIFLRLHPAVSHAFENNHPEFVYNVSSGFSINELLVAADVLITDYSSIPFEFALLEKPMIFFAYDLEDYAVSRGFTENYEDMVPGPIAQQTSDLIDILKTGYFDMEKVRDFASEWNEYVNGQAAASLVEAIYYPERTTHTKDRGKTGQNA